MSEVDFGKMKPGIKIFSLIGIVLFIIILARLDLARLAGIISNTSLPLLLAAILVNCLALVFKVCKWKLIVKSQKQKLGLLPAIKYWLIGFGFSAITPGRIGDALRAYYLKKENYSLGKALSTVAIDRLIDIILLFVIAIIAIIYFSAALGIEIMSNLFIALLFIALLALTCLFWNKKLMKLALKPLYRVFVPEKFKEKMQVYFNEFYEGLSAFQKNKSLFAASILAGLVGWAISFVFVYLLALSVNINISFWYIALLSPVISLLDILPISISGLGTREAAVIFLLSLKGILPEQALAFSLLYFFIGYVLYALAGALLWIKNPTKITK